MIFHNDKHATKGWFDIVIIEANNSLTIIVFSIFYWSRNNTI